MLKEFIGVGNTVEEATKNAKAGLCAPDFADVKIEVVSLPKKKFLGLFGGSDAKVKAWYDAPEKKKKPQRSAERHNEQKPKNNRRQSEKSAKNDNARVKTVVTEQEIKATKLNSDKKSESQKPETHNGEDVEKAENINVDVAVKYLKGILDHLGCEDAKFETSVADGEINIEIVCEDYGIIIGRRGETLDAIQHLTSLAVKKYYDKYIRVSVNVGNYREKRVETVKALARRYAERVASSGRRYTFEPMNPFERRIIHTTVQEIEGVESRSIGMNDDRRVVLEPTGGVKYSNNRGRYNNRRSSSKYQKKDEQSSKPASAPKADRADLPLGKIEIK